MSEHGPLDPAAEPIRARSRLTAAQWPMFLLLLALGCGDGPAAERPRAPVERGPLERIVVATGTIEPAVEVEVRPRIAGIVERIHVEPGDRVEAGQAVLEIERELLSAQVREAEAELRQSSVEQRYAKIALDRAEELRRTSATSDQAYDDASARHQRAEAAVARARARLDTLATQLGYATVRSPLSGRVLDVHVEEGSAVSPVTAVTGGTLLVSLAATDRLHLEGLVDENEVPLVRIGQKARVRTEAYGGTLFRGEVRRIAPLGQRVQNVTYFEVEIALTDPRASELRPRMSGDAEIVAEVVPGAVHVPETALRYEGDRVYVEVVAPDEGEANGAPTSERRDVTVGIVDGARVQILDGLEVGQEIFLQ